MELLFNTYNSIPKYLEKSYDVFLAENGLSNEHDTDFTLLVTDDSGKIMGCGSLKKNILKQLAIDNSCRGEDLCPSILSILIEHAISAGFSHLFLFTKPIYERMFHSMGFHYVVATSDMLIMENRADGISSFLNSLPHLDGIVGAVVCNCNPFTLGHRHLIEYAASNCDNLLVFVLSEDASLFPSDIRYELVKNGTSDIPNVHVVKSSEYIISRATFPAYFLKDSIDVNLAKCDLDIALFGTRIAPALNITRRFIANEPFDEVTAKYNARLHALLPDMGIEVVEIERYKNISATEVRQLFISGDLQSLSRLVPEVTYEYCKSRIG